MMATIETTTADTCGSTDLGRARPARIARSLPCQFRMLSRAITTPRAISGSPISLRPPARWNGGSSSVIARPAVMRPSEVRIQARERCVRWRRRTARPAPSGGRQSLDRCAHQPSPIMSRRAAEAGAVTGGLVTGFPPGDRRPVGGADSGQRSLSQGGHPVMDQASASSVAERQVSCSRPPATFLAPARRPVRLTPTPPATATRLVHTLAVPEALVTAR